MSQKHLKKWYIREEAEDFALYGTDDKNKLIKAEAPYMVVNPAGIGIVYSNNGEFTVDIIDRKSTRLNSSHLKLSRMPSSA